MSDQQPKQIKPKYKPKYKKPKQVPKPETKQEVKQVPKPETKQEVKQVPKQEVKQVPKQEVKQVPEVKEVPKAKPRPKSKYEPKSKPQQETREPSHSLTPLKPPSKSILLPKVYFFPRNALWTSKELVGVLEHANYYSYLRDPVLGEDQTVNWGSYSIKFIDDPDFIWYASDKWSDQFTGPKMLPWNDRSTVCFEAHDMPPEYLTKFIICLMIRGHRIVRTEGHLIQRDALTLTFDQCKFLRDYLTDARLKEDNIARSKR
jgi:hypothetical protein